MEQSRLRELENQCIQDCPPPCSSLCPVHVDIRQLASAAGKGDFEAGYGILRKSVPFPGIIAYTCDQPCRVKCNRSELGGAIEVVALERACVEFHSGPSPKINLLPKKKVRAVVVGGGLSSLSAAYELARKGYTVDLYEQSERLGGGLWDLPETRLPRDILERELKLPAQVGVRIHLSERVSADSPFLERAGAVFLGTTGMLRELCGLDSDCVNPTTYQAGQSKFFCGGNTSGPISTVRAIASGRSGAVSIDRFLENVSLTAGRQNEGAYETGLYTNLEGIEPATAIAVPAGGYLKEGAGREARRCLQCECMECVKACEYLRHYGSYPKKYVREMYNNLSMLVRARTSNQMINTCALCGLCAEVCPTQLDMGQVSLETRQTMVATQRMPASVHDFALRDMAFSDSERFAMGRHAPGMESSKALFFPGCQLSGTHPDYVEQAYEFLRADYESETGLMLRCCGAPAAWAGRTDLFEASQAEFRAWYERMGKPTLILACSSCYQVFSTYYPDISVTSFWEIFDRHGPQSFTGRRAVGKLAVHDPCATRYEAGIQDAVRRILIKLGCEVEELPYSREKTECCSYGGLMWLANRPVAEQTVQRRIHESPNDYVTYCAMCRELFARRGKRTLHLLDLVYGDGNPEAPALGYSQRRENRARLKERLLRELWSERVPEQHPYELIRLVIPEAVKALLEERLILVEDLQKVIEHAERTGKRMINPSNGHSLASLRPASVTYWVEYSPEEGGSYLVHNAYSHRMQIGSENPK